MKQNLIVQTSELLKW